MKLPAPAGRKADSRGSFRASDVLADAADARGGLLARIEWRRPAADLRVLDECPGCGPPLNEPDA